MTKEEAKNAIGCLKEVHDLYDVMCGDWSFCWTAIEALEKQIPKKLAILPEPYINAKKWGCCPNCKWSEIDYRWGMREETSITYCPRCGQAIDWE